MFTDLIPTGLLDYLAHGLWHATAWQTILYTLIMTHITIASVTIFLHRCMAHRALDLHPIASHFFRFWLWLTTGMVTKEWTAIHRKHHAKCETVDDPHSPQIYGLKKLVLEGVELYRAEAKNQETLSQFGHGTPNDWMEKNIYTGRSALGIYLMMAIDMSLFGVGIGLVVWVVQMLWIPVLATGVINGLGHYWGYRNFSPNDASTNVFPWGILIGGEELHNNHHTYGSSAKLSVKWYEFDIGWLYIRILSALKLATVKKVAPTPKFTVAKARADLETLQAIITHRYDVMSKYAVDLKKIYAEEFQKIRAQKQFEPTLLKKVSDWLHQDRSQLQETQRAKLAEVLAHSKALQACYDMGQELQQLWARSTTSREQLLAQLQAWCQKAEASGISHLQAFSLRLRSYAA